MKSVGPLPRQTHIQNSFANTFQEVAEDPAAGRESQRPNLSVLGSPQAYHVLQIYALSQIPRCQRQKVGQGRAVSKERNLKTKR